MFKIALVEDLHSLPIGGPTLKGADSDPVGRDRSQDVEWTCAGPGFRPSQAGGDLLAPRAALDATGSHGRGLHCGGVSVSGRAVLLADRGGGGQCLDRFQRPRSLGV